jgi:drug/metabolite transporter (DMT)-like permease
MLSLAFFLLCVAAAVGCGLAIAYLRGPRRRRPPSVVPIAHGLVGAASLFALLLALAHGLPPSTMGTAGFGPAAAALLGLTLAVGMLLARAAWRRRRPNQLLVGTHAGLAVAGLVVLLTLVALR